MLVSLMASAGCLCRSIDLRKSYADCSKCDGKPSKSYDKKNFDAIRATAHLTRVPLPADCRRAMVQNECSKPAPQLARYAV